MDTDSLSQPGAFKTLTDDELLELSLGTWAPRVAFEIVRRLKETLHAEEVAIRNLTASLVLLTRVLVGATLVLVLLTVVLVWQTGMLLRSGH